jgi:hypothetical protein
MTARRSAPKVPVADARGPGKRASVEAQLAALEEMATNASSPDAQARLRGALRTGRGLVAARAAKIVREHALEGFAADLVAAFRRLLSDPVKNDPGCLGKRVGSMPEFVNGRAPPPARTLRPSACGPRWLVRFPKTRSDERQGLPPVPPSPGTATNVTGTDATVVDGGA